MGSEQSKIKQGCLDSTQDSEGSNKLTDDERLNKIMVFMDCLTCGNFIEANKIIKDFQFCEHPEVDEGILLSLTELMKKANAVLHDQQLRLKENSENFNKTVDMGKMDKKSSIDEVFTALRAELNSIEATYTEFKQKLSSKNHDKHNDTSQKRKDKKLQSFLNVIWLGKYVLQIILCKKGSEKFDMRLDGDEALIPDNDIYDQVEEFAEWMRRVPSFMMFNRILDREVGIDFFEFGKTRNEFHTSVDRFYGGSAKNFEQNMIQIMKRVLEMFDVWIKMEEEYFSQEGLIPLEGEQLETFYSSVKRLNELSNHKVAGRFYDKFSKRKIKMIREQNPQPDPQPHSDNQIITRLRIDNKTLKNQVQRLAKLQQHQKSVIEANNKEIERLNKELKKAEQIEKGLRKDLEQKDIRIAELKDELRRIPRAVPTIPTVDLKPELEQLKRKIQDLQRQQLKRVEKIRESLEKLQEETTSMLNEKKNGSTIDSVRVVDPHFRQELKPEELPKQVDQTHKRVKKTLQKFLSYVNGLEDEIARLNQRIKSLNQIIANSEETIELNKRTIDSLKKDKNSLMGQLQSEKKRLSDQIDNKKKDIERLANDIKRVENDLSAKKIKLSKLQKQNESLVMIQKEEKKASQDEIAQRLHQIRNIKRELENRNFEYIKKCEDIQKMTMTLKKVGRCFTQYFNGRILNINQPEHMQWFVNSLEHETKKQIRATYPLYRYDKDNKVPIHHYIDGKPQIVLIIKMKSGQIIAGYSEPPFKPKTNVDYREGLMFAFRNRKVFTMKKEPSSKANRTNPKPITYDDFFIMWGNSEIRIKTGSEELYSNFATGNSSYEEKGNENLSVADLFLQEERDAFLEDYEFFQVEFEDGDNAW